MVVVRPWIAWCFVGGALAACGGANENDDTTDVTIDAPALPPDACTDGLPCFVVDCQSKGLEPTSVSGTVFAPNGTLPLYNVNVYVPFADPGPLLEGVQCGNCAADLPGGAIASTLTDFEGKFTLQNLPATDNVPLVISTGKWRRQITLPVVAACQDTPLDAASTRLPKNKSEGDIPKIAMTTGNADALECLVHKLGLDTAEFTADSADGRVHLFAANGANTLASGGTLTNATTLWGAEDKLSNYDIVMFSCEGGQAAANKPQSSLDAVEAYANKGGRLFMSHWQNIWVGGEVNNPSRRIADWIDIGTWNFSAPQDRDDNTAKIDQVVPKGIDFAKWMAFVGGSTTLGEVEILDGARYTLTANDPLRSDRRVYIDDPPPHQSVQDLEFSTPQDVELAARCGKVVFSDMHVSADSLSRPGTGMTGGKPNPFPGLCSTEPLTAQEKALAFLFFDISSCVGVVF